MAFNTDISLPTDTMGNLGEPTIALQPNPARNPRSEVSGAARTMGAAALDLLPEAVVVVDGTGQVVGTNRSADDMLARTDGFYVDQGRLATRVLHETRGLAQAIARVACGAESNAVLRVSRNGGQMPFLVTVASVPSETSQCSGIVLFIHDPALSRVPEAGWLSRIYGLTRPCPVPTRSCS